MKTITLTKLELRALEELLWTNPCGGGTCAFEEMESKKIDCDKCKLTEAIQSIREKIS